MKDYSKNLFKKELFNKKNKNKKNLGTKRYKILQERASNSKLN
jgi:hypothetical protein